jgi:hypothetical protein
MMLVRVDTQLLWQIARDPKSDRWVAVCPMLSITAEAETWERLASMLAEEVNELMLDLFEEGELPKFLQERGWQPMMPIPVSMPREGLRFDVPMEMKMAPVAAILAKKNASHAQA